MRSTNFWLSLVIYLLLASMVSTGLLMRYPLPPGSGREGYQFLGLGRHDWGAVHFWIALALLAGIALHLYLQWTWIRVTSPQFWRGAWRLILALLLILAIAAMLVPFFVRPTVSPAEGRGGRMGDVVSTVEEDGQPAEQTQLHRGGGMREERRERSGALQEGR